MYGSSLCWHNHPIDRSTRDDDTELEEWRKKTKQQQRHETKLQLNALRQYRKKWCIAMNCTATMHWQRRFSALPVAHGNHLHPPWRRRDRYSSIRRVQLKQQFMYVWVIVGLLEGGRHSRWRNEMRFHMFQVPARIGFCWAKIRKNSVFTTLRRAMVYSNGRKKVATKQNQLKHTIHLTPNAGQTFMVQLL